jgi:hypothetical protein
VAKANEASRLVDLTAGTGVPTATFNGGATQRLGVGDYCIANRDSDLNLVHGVWYGADKDTNN